MMQLQKRILAVVAACVTTSSMALPVNAVAGANPVLGRDITATLTAKHGTVFKRDFRDWNREEWGAPLPAEVSDQLHEGMQIGTGNESWAEVTWPNVKTRAWANTVFAVAPNKRLVYLTGGEMLFRLDKHRKDKDDYYIWTKVLQARIRGTTVLVQAKGPVTRFTVMEGVVELTNRLDKSRTMLRPGAVWEIKGYNVSKTAPLPTLEGTKSTGDEPYRAQPLVVPKNFDQSINEITYDAKNYLPVFQDKFATSSVYASNSTALLSHPLLNAGSPIDSMELIQQAQANLPGYNRMLPIKVADNARLNKVISSSIDLVAVPSKANYFVGQSVGKEIKLPSVTLGDLQPDGVMMNPATIAADKAVSPATAIMPKPPAFAPVIPGLMMPAPADAQDAKASVFEEDPSPLPQVPYNSTGSPDKLQSSPVPSVVPNTCLSPTAQQNNDAITSSSAFQPMPGALSPNPVPTIPGVLPTSSAKNPLKTEP